MKLTKHYSSVIVTCNFCQTYLKYPKELYGNYFSEPFAEHFSMLKSTKNYEALRISMETLKLGAASICNVEILGAGRTQSKLGSTLFEYILVIITPRMLHQVLEFP